MKKITIIIGCFLLLIEISAQINTNSIQNKATQSRPIRGIPQAIMKYVCNCCNSSTLSGGLADQVSHGKTCCTKKVVDTTIVIVK